MDDFQEGQDKGRHTNSKYYLLSIIELMGAPSLHGSGSYNVYTLRESQWYRFNDEIFVKTTRSAALKRSPYILFYHLM